MSCGGGRPKTRPKTKREDLDGNDSKRINSFQVQAYYLDFDGEKYTPVWHYFDIKPFEGEREITSLEFFPSRYLPKAAERQERLIARGLKFKDFTTFKHQRYKGFTFSCQPCGCPFEGRYISKHPELIESNVMVDFAEGIQDDYGWTPNLCYDDGPEDHNNEIEDDMPVVIWEDQEHKWLYEERRDLAYADDRIKISRRTDFLSTQPLLKEVFGSPSTETYALQDTDLLLLPARVLAYAFRDRKFGMGN